VPRETLNGVFSKDIEEAYNLPNDLSGFDTDALFMMQDLLKNADAEMLHLAKELLNHSDFTNEALERNKWLALSIAKKYYILTRNGLSVRRPAYVTKETYDRFNAVYINKVFPLLMKIWREALSMGFSLEVLEELGDIEDPQVLTAQIAAQKARVGNR
jgi:hypothetical protein